MKLLAFTVHMDEVWNEDIDELVRRGDVCLGEVVVFSREYDRYEGEDRLVKDFADRLGEVLDVRSE